MRRSKVARPIGPIFVTVRAVASYAICGLVGLGLFLYWMGGCNSNDAVFGGVLCASFLMMVFMVYFGTWLVVSRRRLTSAAKAVLLPIFLGGITLAVTSVWCTGNLPSGCPDA